MQFVILKTENAWCNDTQSVQKILMIAESICQNFQKITMKMIKQILSNGQQTDRANLINHQESLLDYIKLVVSQLQKLTAHSYIAKSQTKYLELRKEEIDAETLCESLVSPANHESKFPEK